MEVVVNEQTQVFYLAMEKWERVVGHEIKVGYYRFCAIPLKGNLNISEATTGAKVFSIHMNDAMLAVMATKEDSMQYLEKIGVQLKKIIGRRDNFDNQILEMGKKAVERLGEKPKTFNLNIDWIFEEESEFLN